MKIKKTKDNLITMKGLTLDEFVLIFARLGSNFDSRNENLNDEVSVAAPLFEKLSNFSYKTMGEKYSNDLSRIFKEKENVVREIFNGSDKSS